jgi:hypothetical protein
VPAISDDSGSLVPDLRKPTFSVPAWVTVPSAIAQQRETTAAAAKAKLPYRVERALHFSNGGGVYRASDPATGRVVVLREARPLAGLDMDEDDAVGRLTRERAVLGRLAGLDAVPELVGSFSCWEHQYLVEDYIEGDLLQQAIGSRFPLIYPRASRRELADYTSWALRTLADIERALDAIHDRGIVYGDLHPHNVIVRPDGRIALVDFEQSFDIGEERGSSLGAPGFVAPWPLTGVSVDDYALSCLRLAFFLPLSVLLTLDPGKAPQFVAAVSGLYPVPSEFTVKLLAGLTPPADWDEAGWRARRPGLGRSTDLFGSSCGLESSASSGAQAVDPQDWLPSMIKAILASATPERADRLFPGDVEQFAEGGVGVAHGAAGVLYALAAIGEPVRPEHADWLSLAARRWEPAAPGLFGGLHGVAVVLAMLGQADAAIEIATRAANLSWQPRQVGLYRGLAGVGLAWLHLAAATGGAGFEDDARRIGQSLVAAVTDEPGAATIQPRRPGLLYGWSGVAAFLIRLYERTLDRGYLAAAELALRRDLGHCVTTRSGGLQMQVPPRLLLYLADGSLGTGLVLRDLQTHRPDAQLAGLADQISIDLAADFVAFPGLFNGRAGLLLAAACHPEPDNPSSPAASQSQVQHHLRGLAWHALSYQGQLAFPGNGLMRLSMDLATGSAGIAYACHRAHDPGAAAFPLLDGTGRAGRQAVLTGSGKEVTT